MLTADMLSAFFQIALKFGLVLKVSEVWLRKPVRKGEVWPSPKVSVSRHVRDVINAAFKGSQ